MAIPPRKTRTFIAMACVCPYAMAAKQPATPDSTEMETHERDTYVRMMKVVSAIAQAMGNSSQISVARTDRDDMHGFKVDNPVTPVEVYAKRGVKDDGWGYEWARIHVHISSDSIGTTRIMNIKQEHGLEVVDVWQFNQDETADMGQHNRPAVRFALEPRE